MKTRTLYLIILLIVLLPLTMGGCDDDHDYTCERPSKTTTDTTTVPCPGAIVLLGLGTVGVGLIKRWRML